MSSYISSVGNHELSFDPALRGLEQELSLSMGRCGHTGFCICALYLSLNRCDHTGFCVCVSAFVFVSKIGQVWAWMDRFWKVIVVVVKNLDRYWWAVPGYQPGLFPSIVFWMNEMVKDLLVQKMMLRSMIYSSQRPPARKTAHMAEGNCDVESIDYFLLLCVGSC